MENPVSFVDQYAVYAMLAVMLIDFILGKTKWVSANSGLEAVLNAVMSILKSIFGKKESKEEAPK